MKRLFYSLALALIAIVASTSCSSTKSADEAEADSLGLDWDSTCAPIPMNEVLIPASDDIDYDVIGHYLLYVMEGQEDSARIAPVAKSYQTLSYGGKKIKIYYDGIQNGPECGSIILDNRNAKYMKGYRYKYDEQALMGEGDGIAFNDDFLANHKIIEDLKTYTVDYEGTQKEMPSALKDSLKARYKMEIQNSLLMAESKETGLAIYTVQMEPKDNKALGMHVITVDDKIYVKEDWANADEEGNFCWHVDDDGVYFGGDVLAVTSGEKGYDIFIRTLAPESTSFDALLLRDGQVNEVDMASYYNYIDYTPPLEATTLPAGSKLADELDGYKVWIHTDDPGDEYGNGLITSVYYKKPDSKTIYRLLTAGTDPDALKPYSEQNGYVIYVQPKDVIIAQQARIVTNSEGGYKLILEGCPDGRNQYSFVTSLPVESSGQMYAWIRCFEGYAEYDEHYNAFMFFDYRYHDEGGRYSVRMFFGFDDLNPIKEEPWEEGEEE